jgi:predicted DNA-binding transcriptional regulator YafY
MRVIEPHALAFDGFRWHARARDAEAGAFKDYLLGRLSKADLLGPAGAPASHDADWESWVVLVIAANPGLPGAQKAIIERDYSMRGGRAELKVRRALAHYAKQRLGLDLDPAARTPQDQHIVLVEERDAQPGSTPAR